MADITIDQAQQCLNDALAAHAAVMSGQQFELNGRRVTRANLRELREDIDYWRKLVRQLSGSYAPRIRQISPR